MKKILLTPVLLAILQLGCGKTSPTSAEAVPAKDAAPVAAEKSSSSAPLEIPAGTQLRVRTVQALDTERNRAGDQFEATLASPVSVGSTVALPRGTKFNGHVTTAYSSGRLKGRGYMAVVLDSFELNGQTHRIATSARGQATGAHRNRNLALIGGGAGLGAMLGGIAGGGKGALIGAGSGAAAGTAGAAITGKKDVHIPSETLMAFTLKEPVAVAAQ